MEQMIAHSGKRVKEENSKTKGSAIEKEAHLYSKMGLLLIVGSPGRTRIPLHAGSPLRFDRFRNPFVV